MYNQKKEREEAGADGEGSEDQDPDNEDDFCRQMKRDEEGPNLLMKLQVGILKLDPESDFQFFCDSTSGVGSSKKRNHNTY